MNNLPSLSYSAGTRSRLYADDHCLYKPLSNMNDIAEIQRDIELVDSWSVNNHLQPNALKTKYMIISRKRQKRNYSHLFLNGSQLEQVSRYKYLGVIINESLSWSEQVNCVSNRAKTTLGYIYRQFHRFCCRSALLKLYSSLLLPILDYNSLIWDPHLLKDMRQLDSVQTCMPNGHKTWSASDSELNMPLTITENSSNVFQTLLSLQVTKPPQSCSKQPTLFFQIKRMIQSSARNSILGIYGWIQLSASRH